MARSFWLFCVIALGISAVQNPVEARDGRIISLRGAATLNGAAMRRSNAINGGDRIETQAASRVKIMMNDGTVLDIGPDTAFKIDSFAYRKDEPSSWSSGFSLLRGALRYVSGLIARKDARKVHIGVGMATIGIRGSFDTISFDGTTITIDSEIGEATIQFPPRAAFPKGQTVRVPAGNRGNLNPGTGHHNVGALPIPSPVAQAAKAIAGSPDNADKVTAALAGKSEAEQALVFAVLLNNADHLGVTDHSALTRALGHAATANNANVALMVFIATSLDPANADGYVAQATQAVPGAANQIRSAAILGVNKDEKVPDNGLKNLPNNTPDKNQDNNQGEKQGQNKNSENPATTDSETVPGQVPSSTEP